MAKILRQNVGGVDFTMAGCALTGVCPTAAADYVKQITLSDGDVIEDGMMMVVTFANGNTAGNAPNTKTIYSSDQVNYFEDEQLTVPFTLAPSGCYEIEYTGTVNAYTYTDYPVFQVGSVSGPVCDYRGHIASSDLWDAGDLVQCIFKEGKFLLLGGSGSADAGTGNPIGTILPLYKKSTPNGYLYCDGSTFDTTAYPGLYAYLGTNVLPDYREFALVGAEENTTDVYNATTNPNGTIHDHDVYSQGEAKDDQVQSHTHSQQRYSSGPDNIYSTGPYGTVANISTSNAEGARVGSVTRGKRKAVYFYIKATSGLTENQQDYVLDTLNDTLRQQRSYSTDEHLTGKYWIDGKPIYSKTFYSATNWANYTVIGNIPNIDAIVSIKDITGQTDNKYIQNFGMNNDGTQASYSDVDVSNGNVAVIRLGTFENNLPSSVTIEYTKTTD